jgi:hypothetical protein
MAKAQINFPDGTTVKLEGTQSSPASKHQASAVWNG